MNFVNLSNIVSYCEIRLNPQEVNVIIQNGKRVGLSNPEVLRENLHSSNYIPILNATWSERNRSRRLEWLRSHQSEMHAPLMFEQSIAEFINNPTVETIIQISMPLIFAAAFRVRQDSQCSTDASVYNGDAARRMQFTYQVSLNTQTTKHLKRMLKEIVLENERAVVFASETKVLEIAQSTISKDLPSPNWIGHHGVSIFLTGKIEMHPAADFKNIRDEFAKKELKANSQNQISITE